MTDPSQITSLNRVAGWIALYPWWYTAERSAVERQFPDFRASERELSRGVLAFKGTLRVDLGSEVQENHVLLHYHEETPYHIPAVYPLTDLPAGDDWSVTSVITTLARRMPAGYRRHQMAEPAAPNLAGNLCVIEVGAGDRSEIISGVAVLRRAKAVFQAVALGKPFPFPDADADDLDAHFLRLGDIILGDSFFEDDIGSEGAFWGIATFDELDTLPSYVEQTTKTPRRLHVGLHLAKREGALETDWRTERSRATRRAFPFIANGALSFEAELRKAKPFLDSSLIGGRWVQLSEEPEPFTSALELSRILESQLETEDGIGYLLNLFPSFASMNDHAWLGLRYPTPADDWRWLFVQLTPLERLSKSDLEANGEGIRREVLRDAGIIALRAHRLSRPALELRNQGTISPEIDDKTLLILGCGALGGDVAISLAKAGVRKLILVDPDVITPGNVIRHAAGLAATGLNKTDAIRHLVHQHNPFVDVECIPTTATDPRETIDELLQRADLAVCTIADENVELVINESGIRTGKTVIYGRALRSGSTARIFRVRPGVDACKSCLALFREAAEGGKDNSWIVVPSSHEEVLARECGQPILAGSAADLRLAADFTARAALDELEGGSDWNNLLWIREPWPDAPNSVQPYSVIRHRFPPIDHCPVCSRPRVTSIHIEEAAMLNLRKFAESKRTVETGGALIGYESEGVVHVIDLTDAGPGAIETATRFQYDAEYVNQRLRAAAERFGDRGLYVGEWHTHLETPPIPSMRDITSLADIAVAPNFLTDEPIMLIAGLNPDTGLVDAIHSSAFPIHRTMHSVPLTIGSTNVSCA